MKQKMKGIENVNLDSVIVKENVAVVTDDMKNEFINEELILMPLYKKIKIDSSLYSYKFFPYNDLRIECYCNKCKKRRIFSFENANFPKTFPGLISDYTVLQIFNRIDYFRFIAIADCKHELIIDFKILDNCTVEKVGQFPSIYDMNEKINNKIFLNLLDEEYRGYYKTACSLYSYDSCIGALTYLRRIFEKILIDTFDENKENIDISFREFSKERMEDKIKILKPYLPELMFEDGFNKIYTKISDGIHNLNEDECYRIFIILKSGIEEILIDKLEKKEKKKRRSELKKNLINI